MPNTCLTKRGFFAALAATAVAPILPRPALARQQSVYYQNAFSAADRVESVWTNRPNLGSLKMVLQHNGKFKEGVVQGDGTVTFDGVKIPKGGVFYINTYGINDL